MIILLFVLAQLAVASGADELWSLVRLEGQPAGYTCLKVEPVTVNGEQRFVTTDVFAMQFMRLGNTAKIMMTTTTTEDAQGKVLSIVMDADLSSSKSRTELMVEGAKCRVIEQVMDQKRERTEDWNEKCLGPHFVRRDLASKPMQKGDRYEYPSYMMELSKASKQTYEVLGPETVTVGNEQRKLVNVRVVTEDMPATPALIWLDESMRPVITVQEMVGMKLEAMQTDKESALQGLTGKAVTTDAIMTSAVQLNVALPHAYQIDEVTYRFSRKKSEAVLPSMEDARQKISPGATADTIEMTVKKITPRGESHQQCPLPSVPPEMAPYLKASSLLQSDHPKVIEAANKAIEGEHNAWRAAQKLERFAHQHISKKGYGVAFASAAEVLANGEGDCSEHSVLLAALARAAGIPSRIAVGVLYFEGTLAGHMWAEVSIDSQWYALDASLGLGYVGATHVAFTKAEMNDDSEDSGFALMGQTLGYMNGEVLEYVLGKKRFRADDGSKPWRIEDDTFEHMALGVSLEKPEGWEWVEGKSVRDLVTMRSESGEKIELEFATVGYDFNLLDVVKQVEGRGGLISKREYTVGDCPAQELWIKGGERRQAVVFIFADDTLYIVKGTPRESEESLEALEIVLDSMTFGKIAENE